MEFYRKGSRTTAGCFKKNNSKVRGEECGRVVKVWVMGEQVQQ